ncbi:hypothetical protein Pa4123_92170 [Phytohabitans aurantiacus]|uniref:Uncharacterized protein n=1 Tax=Phytohabitans aurantiacus TaxID=3016789 RepID=A0ABQ5REB3_9ACTN|nr:hypothetical protein Pa4123_92170 [Phytohabitans aurantiacus]
MGDGLIVEAGRTSRRPASDGLCVLPPIAVELTDDVYARAVTALAQIMAAQWNSQLEVTEQEARPVRAPSSAGVSDLK